VNLTLNAAQKQQTVSALSKLVVQVTSKPEGCVQVLVNDGVAMVPHLAE
jgi:phenylpyruvate tautomerase PptA (4-oxalocrotonate tautomerase family)